ncbi:MAG: hypothetical protein AB7N91_20365 [Candidatus Tectimicrobiota bacterium]
MLQFSGKSLGISLVLLCLMSPLGLAMEMVCAKDNGARTCIAATTPAGQNVVVVGEGLQSGEKMDCEDRGHMIACKAVIPYSPPLPTAEMVCAKDNGAHTCIAGTQANGQNVIVVGEGVRQGEKMNCEDRGNMIMCRAM